ncbi:Inorganic pyrophosphatase 2 [Apostasia shenzhenica]|uniref:Inorganic pyrophosphatase 2 n=1 Tax=Apostasia shenzhenica TaxID=1088818 RepID=A0A2I0A284_9ASPA|nr:Inorganic pyrophosphatase 2 [Apostasia shenzhenica]
MAGTVVIFDFDKTIIDCDSDNWVVEELGATELFDSLLPTMPWNSLMVFVRFSSDFLLCRLEKLDHIVHLVRFQDRMMKELHARGKTVEDIAEVLKRAPLDPRAISGIKSAYALGCDLRVVSDANMFFIETILKHYGIIGCFTEINTNPSYVDEEGRLRIFPYHDFTKSSHGCPFCPPNMCKSKIVERIRSSALAEGKKRFIYLGDGKGDYCPSLLLSEIDFVMPRKNFPLWDLIVKDHSALKAEVHEWSNAEEQERVLLQLINRIAAGNAAAATVPLLTVECKLEMLPVAAPEPLPKALPVSQ